MTGTRVLALAAALTAFGLAPPPQPPAQAAQQLLLKSGTSSVAVHVLVSNRRGPVRGLTAADFDLTDSGVRQTIATMTIDPLPLDVSIVVDQLQQSEFATMNRHPQVEDIEELLDGDDRLSVISVGADVREVYPLSTPGTAATVRPDTKSDQAAVYDAVAAALLRPVPPGRQHLVLVLSEAYDTFSFTSPSVLTSIAERTGAQMHVLLGEGRQQKTRTLGRAPNVAPVDDGLGLLLDAAKTTGGDMLSTGRMSRSISGPVKRIVDEVRAGYVLYYTPAGVPDRGWHPITVKVSRPGEFQVRARPGYAN